MTNMTEAMEPVRLPAQLVDELVALQDRSERLTRSSLRYLGVAAATFVASGVLGGLAWWLGPDAALKAVHLPSEIANLFPANARGHGRSFSDVAVNVASLGRNLSVVCGVLMIVGSLYSLWRALAEDRQTPSSALMGLLLAPLLFVAPTMLGLFEEPTDSRDAERGPRQAFVAYLEDANYPAVQQALKEIDASKTVTSYMLAQVAVAQAQRAEKPIEPSALSALKDQVNLLGESLPKQLTFTVSPQAVYAIEVAALGKASSSVAEAYLVDAQHKKVSARAGQVVAGLLALAAGLVSGGLLLISRRIRARLDRILPLVNPLTETAAGDAVKTDR